MERAPSREERHLRLEQTLTDLATQLQLTRHDYISEASDSRELFAQAKQGPRCPFRLRLDEAVCLDFRTQLVRTRHAPQRPRPVGDGRPDDAGGDTLAPGKLQRQKSFNLFPTLDQLVRVRIHDLNDGSLDLPGNRRQCQTQPEKERSLRLIEILRLPDLHQLVLVKLKHNGKLDLVK